MFETLPGGDGTTSRFVLFQERFRSQMTSFPKQFCEIGATGCCKNNISINVRKCSPLRVYFHRNSTGCDKAFCFGIYCTSSQYTKYGWKRFIDYIVVCLSVFRIPCIRGGRGG